MSISVVIPCFNVEEYIDECLQAVFSQTKLPDEVICVDNNSTDQTWFRLNYLKASLYPNLILLTENEKGASYARNKGLKVVRSEWVQFLDADDLISPTKLAHQWKLIERSSGCAFVAAAYTRLSLDGVNNEASVSSNNWLAAFTNCGGITSSNLWNTAVLCDVGGWNGALQSSQEADLMFRLVLTGMPVLIDAHPLTVIRQRASGQISQSDPIQRYRRFLEVRIDYLNKLQQFFPERYAENYQELTTYLLSNILILENLDVASAKPYLEAIGLAEWRPQAGYGMASWKAHVIKWFGFPFYSRLKQIIS